MTVVAKISKADKLSRAGTTGLCAGANLRTPIGERRVEFLRKGDLVVTRITGGTAIGITIGSISNSGGLPRPSRNCGSSFSDRAAATAISATTPW